MISLYVNEVVRNLVTIANNILALCNQKMANISKNKSQDLLRYTAIIKILLINCTVLRFPLLYYMLFIHLFIYFFQ